MQFNRIADKKFVEKLSSFFFNFFIILILYLCFVTVPTKESFCLLQPVTYACIAQHLKVHKRANMLFTNNFLLLHDVAHSARQPHQSKFVKATSTSTSTVS